MDSTVNFVVILSFLSSSNIAVRDVFKVAVDEFLATLSWICRLIVVKHCSPASCNSFSVAVDGIVDVVVSVIINASNTNFPLFDAVVTLCFGCVVLCSGAIGSNAVLSAVLCRGLE